LALANKLGFTVTSTHRIKIRGLGLQPSKPVWQHLNFTRNQDRLLAHCVADLFFAGGHVARGNCRATDARFTKVGAMIDDCSSQKNFPPKGWANEQEEGTRVTL
jgi:hypothetical protein